MIATLVLEVKEGKKGSFHTGTCTIDGKKTHIAFFKDKKDPTKITAKCSRWNGGMRSFQDVDAYIEVLSFDEDKLEAVITDGETSTAELWDKLCKMESKLDAILDALTKV